MKNERLSESADIARWVLDNSCLIDDPFRDMAYSIAYKLINEGSVSQKQMHAMRSIYLTAWGILNNGRYARRYRNTHRRREDSGEEPFSTEDESHMIYEAYL